MDTLGTPRGRSDQAPAVQRIRLRYAKRGRLRFTSHRDFARAFERALRRARVPVAYSAGFTPHPKVSYVGAAPTGVASEAEYLELGLAVPVDPEQLRRALDEALPAGLDIVDAVDATAAAGAPRVAGLTDRMAASRWRFELPGVTYDTAGQALKLLLDRAEVPVERLTKSGRRQVDVRAAVLRAELVDPPVGPPEDRSPTDTEGSSPGQAAYCAILDLVVRHVTPSVRPDDVLAGLRAVAAFEPPVPPRVTRLAQGPLDEDGQIVDPLAADR